jgi:hypothetical protein
VGVGNINISGNISGGQQNIGETNIQGGQNQTNNYAGQITADQVLNKLADAIPAEDRDKVEAEVFGPLREEIRTLTAMPIAQAEEEKQSFLDRAKSIVSGLAPYSEKINKVALSIGEAALSSIAPPVGWFVSGVLAGVRALRESQG